MPPSFPILNRPIVLIDLDDTLAVFDGWKGWRHIGEPRPYAQEFVRKFKEHRWITVLWTTRAESGLLEEWLEEYNFRDEQVGEGLAYKPQRKLLFDYIGTFPSVGLLPSTTAYKPITDLIIDNSAYPFCGKPVPLETVMEDLLGRGILQRQYDDKSRNDNP